MFFYLIQAWWRKANVLDLRRNDIREKTKFLMINLKLIDKELIKMPNLKYVEDTATWFKILRNGYTAYGISDVYSYYRRSVNTESSNKLKIQKSLWKLYREEEKMGFFKSLKTLFVKNLNAIKRRI